jgi:hypothetical protein
VYENEIWSFGAAAAAAAAAAACPEASAPDSAPTWATSGDSKVFLDP